jgi:hypothetical protein
MTSAEAICNAKYPSETLEQIGVLPVKMEAANRREKRLVLLGFAEEVSACLSLTDDGMMRIAMGK